MFSRHEFHTKLTDIYQARSQDFSWGGGGGRGGAYLKNRDQIINTIIYVMTL